VPIATKNEEVYFRRENGNKNFTFTSVKMTLSSPRYKTKVEKLNLAAGNLLQEFPLEWHVTTSSL